MLWKCEYGKQMSLASKHEKSPPLLIMKEAFRHLEVFNLMTSNFNERSLIGCDDRVGEIRKSEECSDEAFQKVLTSSRPKLTNPLG